MNRAEYLNIALQIGMDVKSAMLTEIRTVFEICEARARAAEEHRRK